MGGIDFRERGLIPRNPRSRSRADREAIMNADRQGFEIRLRRRRILGETLVHFIDTFGFKALALGESL